MEQHETHDGQSLRAKKGHHFCCKRNNPLEADTVIDPDDPCEQQENNVFENNELRIWEFF